MEPVLVFFFFFHCFLDSFLLRYRLSTTASLAEANGNCATCDGQGKKGTGLGASRSPRQLFFVHSVASVTVLFFFFQFIWACHFWGNKCWSAKNRNVRFPLRLLSPKILNSVAKFLISCNLFAQFQIFLIINKTYDDFYYNFNEQNYAKTLESWNVCGLNTSPLGVRAKNF